MSDADDVLAAEFVLGLLSPETMSALDSRVQRDQGFAALVERWRKQLAPLDTLVDPVSPPDDLFERIDQAVDRLDPSPAGTVTRRAGEGVWEPEADRVASKQLWHDRLAGRVTRLVKIDPGGRYVGHHHPADETCYVLEGELQLGDLVLRAGDFHVALAGSDHPPAASKSGCLLLIQSAV